MKILNKSEKTILEVTNKDRIKKLLGYPDKFEKVEEEQPTYFRNNNKKDNSNKDNKTKKDEKPIENENEIVDSDNQKDNLEDNSGKEQSADKNAENENQEN